MKIIDEKTNKEIPVDLFRAINVIGYYDQNGRKDILPSDNYFSDKPNILETDGEFDKDIETLILLEHNGNLNVKALAHYEECEALLFLVNLEYA